GGYVRVAHTGTLSSTLAAFNDTDTAPIQAISNSFWTVSAGGFSGVGGSPFTIQASGTNFGTVANLSHIRLVQTSAAIVGSSPGTNSGTLTNPTIQRINVSLSNLSTNTIHFGTTNFTLSPLPVTLLFFNAQLDLDYVNLDWATSNEEDFEHFVIQHSVDGFNYTDISEVPGAGYNTTSRNDYTYTHTLPIIGNNYYRLKAVDLDGSYEYFGPVAVSYMSQSELWIHPNPSSSEKVEYKMNFSPDEGDRVQVYNQIGLMVADVPAAGKNGVVYFAEPLKAGAYILRYSSASNVWFARFVVLK
ncbi:MAG: hypothetical protein OEU76_08390, partial [Cyclobacteriaceae bacterium]|nr:hypothetical protein [Cyclobacteriaceae bacterium]